MNTFTGWTFDQIVADWRQQIALCNSLHLQLTGLNEQYIKFDRQDELLEIGVNNLTQRELDELNSLTQETSQTNRNQLYENLASLRNTVQFVDCRISALDEYCCQVFDYPLMM
jgi:hypothetical protein